MRLNIEVGKRYIILEDICYMNTDNLFRNLPIEHYTGKFETLCLTSKDIISITSKLMQDFALLKLRKDDIILVLAVEYNDNNEIVYIEFEGPNMRQDTWNYILVDYLKEI